MARAVPGPSSTARKQPPPPTATRRPPSCGTCRSNSRDSGVMAAATMIDSPIGEILLTAEAGTLTGLYMGHADPRVDIPDIGGTDRVLDATAEQLAAYFAGDLTDFDVPIAPRGTPFQQQVWAELRRVPYGSTATYGEVAARIGRPTASRAVGAANGRNPISIIVPCHRLVGSNGSLVKYGGGLDRKRFLLALEAGRGRGQAVPAAWLTSFAN